MTDASSVQEKHYSLFTALCMIIGICIGSGIYFKADNVLVATGGNIALGVAMFCVASIVIVFGGLTLSVYAAREDGAGGVLDYADKYLPGPVARVFSWNYATLYLPGITAVLCWVVGVYFCMVFGLPGDFGVQMLVGVAYLLLCAAWNVLWPKVSGWFQNGTTIIKVLPLIVVGAAGLVLGVERGFGGADAAAMGSQAEVLAAAAAATGTTGGLAWLTASAPVAFSFDGWSIGATIAPELRDARRNLPIALAVAPLVILALYLAYFVGLSTVLGPAQVMASGDASLGLFFGQLLGDSAQTVVNVVALVSVMGTVNGVLLSCMRMPYALGLKGNFPLAGRMAHVDATTRFPVGSAVAGVGMTLAWMAVHAVVTTLGLIPNGDISEVIISFNMLLTAVLLARVAGLRGLGAGVVRGRLAPVVATVGCVFVAGSGLLSPSRWPFVGLCAAIMVALSVWYARRPGARE